MRRQKGFTLIELMVVVAILGILATTAVPFYQTWTQRAYGSQATMIMKSLVDGQIMYYLENNKFYPDEGKPPIFVPYKGEGTPWPSDALDGIEKNLKVKVSQSPQFNYMIVNYGGDDGVTIKIEAPFPLFKGQGSPGYLFATVNPRGEVIYAGP